MDLGHLVVRASSGGDLIESFAEPHLSDPFWAKRAGCSEVSEKPSETAGLLIRNTSLATSTKHSRGGFVVPYRRNSVPRK